MSNPVRWGLSKWARWGLLAVTLAMGAALISTAWINRNRVDAASEVLIIGQGEAFLRKLIAELQDQPNATEVQLSEFLSENAPAGVRYIELRTPEGRYRSVGTLTVPVPNPIPERRGPFQTARWGERVLLIGRLPPRPRERGPHGFGESPPPHFLGQRSSPPPRPPQLLLEFEPVVGNGLRDHARRALVLNCTVAAVFLVVSAALWQLLRQRERAEARAEHERRLAVLGEMSAVLAHEIRNPLASLKGHAQLLSEQLEIGTAQRRKADRVVLEAERIEALSSSLLDFVRSGSIERQAVSPRELVSQSAASIKSSLKIDSDLAPDTWPLDRLRMRQVFTNLLENAAQASEAQPAEVRIVKDQGRLTVTVRDHGPGIPAGEEERVFEAFHTTRTRGVGLGLAVARRIVELHGGNIQAANHPDGGAVFTVSIPKES